MSEVYRDFLKDSEIKAFDRNHRGILKYNISRYEEAVQRGKQQYKDLDKARKRAANIKSRVVNELDKYLTEFEFNFINNGGRLIWAQDAGEAIKEILSILTKYDVKNTVKSKSMITEEIELNEHLGKNAINVVETDLGEFIVQIAGEKPYHIITPVMHKSKEDIAELFNKKFDMPANSTPEEITGFVRKLLRDKFTSADVGVTGANFVIADVGGIALTENEGNALMTVSFPKLLIVIAGIERLIPSVADLDLFWPLLGSHGTGQKITAYSTIMTGPRQENEKDGPEEMYVVLLDNKRTNVLEKVNQRNALTCIRCGACLNYCPVYKTIGGHTYKSTYSGPVGSIITPYLKSIEDYNHLSFACSLCGRCTENCPLHIDLHKLLLYNRNDFVKSGEKKSDRFAMFVWKKIMLNRKLMNFGGERLRNILIGKLFKKAWGPRRELPLIKKDTFNKIWKKTENNRNNR